MSVPSEQAVFNAGQWLTRETARRASEPVLRCNGEQLSGARVVESALAFQGELARLGIARGERVLIVARDTPCFVAAFLGAMRAGAVPVPISTLLPPKDIAFIARDAD